MNKNNLVCIAAVFCAAFSLAPAHAESACHFVEQASLSLSHAEQSRTPTVAGQINGQPVRMLLDTGATETFITRTEADRQNLNPERIKKQTQGVGGLSSVFLVKVRDFAIGDAHVTNLRFPVNEIFGQKDVSALIGADFLLQYDMELNLAENSVKLFRADHCAEKGLAYWDQNAMTVPIELLDKSQSARVQVKINGIAIWAMVDSGAARSTIDLSTARKLGFSVDAPNVRKSGHFAGIGPAVRDAWNMTFDSFAIGDEVIQHPTIAIIDGDDAFLGRKPFQMLLGRDFLRSHRVMLAPSQMLLYYSYLGGQVFSTSERSAPKPQHAAP